MNRFIITIITFSYMICKLNADSIKYKSHNSLIEKTLTNVIILNSDSQFVYYKNNFSLNTNKIPCSQIIEIKNELDKIIEPSCMLNIKNIKNKQITKKTTQKNIKKENQKKIKKELTMIKKKPPDSLNNQNLPPLKNNRYINNILLITLIVLLIIIKYKKG